MRKKRSPTFMLEPTMAGMLQTMAAIQIRTAVATVIIKARRPPPDYDELNREMRKEMIYELYIYSLRTRD